MFQPQIRDRTWLLQCFSIPMTDKEVDALFDDLPPVERKRPLALPDRNKEEQAAEKRIHVASNTHAAPLPVVSTKAVSLVNDWIASYDKDVKAGRIGLVPAPLKEHVHDGSTISSDVRSFVEHFCEWTLKKQ